MHRELYKHPLYRVRPELLGTDDRIKLAYERTRLILQTWDLSLKDIGHCSQRFWDTQADPIFTLDPAVSSILACTANLFVGTLAPLVRKRPYLQSVVERALKGEIFGNFLLSELGHGLDILNLETTATKVQDGFILNTPHMGAAKFMPPTTPIDGFPKVAIVMAKLVVDEEDRGIHPFLVETSDKLGMCRGVSSTRLPGRSGSSPVDYALTTFDHVHLPGTSFLGINPDKPENKQMLLHSYIWRIPIGTAVLSVYVSNAAKFIACIGADYSFRRSVQGKGEEQIPIISFRTQQLPILYATAIAHVLSVWRPRFVEYVKSEDEDPRSRYGMSIVFKSTVNRLTAMIARDVGERLGAQGLFSHNVISQMEMDNRGMGTAEGDILVVSIRLFTELLLDRYTLPEPSHTETLLSKHYSAIFTRCSTMLSAFPKGHRDPQFSSLVLPQCELALIALGHALAYSAALDAQLPRPLLDLFELAIIKLDAAWYAQYAGITEDALMEREDRVVVQALPHLKDYVDALNIRQYVTAPIISDSAWDDWVGCLNWHRYKTGAVHRSRLKLPARL